MNLKNCVIVLMVVGAFGFTGVMVCLFVLYQSIPDSLVNPFFGFVSFELGAMAAIQTSKIKNEAKSAPKRRDL